MQNYIEKNQAEKRKIQNVYLEDKRITMKHKQSKEKPDAKFNKSSGDLSARHPRLS